MNRSSVRTLDLTDIPFFSASTGQGYDKRLGRSSAIAG
jgi:hypothetical protein